MTRGVGVIEREALLARLQDSADVPVAVVQAGAGVREDPSAWSSRALD